MNEREREREMKEMKERKSGRKRADRQIGETIDEEKQRAFFAIMTRGACVHQK